MDPNAAWSELLQALIDDDWPAACDAAETLAEWLRRGGFSPQIVTDFPPEHPLHRRFALAVCEQVLQATGLSRRSFLIPREESRWWVVCACALPPAPGSFRWDLTERHIHE